MPLPRFTLADLLCLVALACTAFPIVQRWEAWGPLKTEGCFVRSCRPFSPDGNRLLLTTKEEADVLVWDVQKNRLVCRMSGHVGKIRSALFFPDGRRVLTISGDRDDRTARLWDALTGLPVGPPLEHTSEVLSACVAPDGLTVATGCKDGSVVLWDTRNHARMHLLQGHIESAFDVSFLDDGSRLISDGMGEINGSHRRLWGSAFCVWDTKTGALRGMWNGTLDAGRIPREISMNRHGAYHPYRMSADGRWGVEYEHPSYGAEEFWLHDRATGRAVPDVWGQGSYYFSPNRPQLVVMDPGREWKATLWTLRHPPEWWGHFCRPEVWAAIGILAAWAGVRRRARRRTSA